MTLLTEYSTINDDRLKSVIYENKKMRKYFSQSWDGIKPKSYCGLIHIDGEDYYILPKISNEETNLNIFLHMLMLSYDIPLENEDFASRDNQKDKIIEIFIKLFTQKFIKELRFGLIKQYITYQENLRMLRGKYLVNENIKHNFTNQKIYCEFDEFSPDNELNQFFLYAIKIFMRHSHNKKELKMCETILDEVSYRHIDINKLNIHFDRLNIRYKESFDIALMILRHYVPLMSKKDKSFAFLFDMNELFENFVGKLLPDAKLQNQKDFGNLRLKPDIRIDNLIIDTKYKKVSNKEDINRDDKYQMFAYGKNFGVKKTMLLYPKHIDDVREDLKLGIDEDCVKLAMRSLDLNFEGEYEEFVVEMKKRMEEIIYE